MYVLYLRTPLPTLLAPGGTLAHNQIQGREGWVEAVIDMGLYKGRADWSELYSRSTWARWAGLLKISSAADVHLSS
jgi:hypothetical protein